MSSSEIETSGRVPEARDVFVHGYERVEDGHEEWVDEYWRASPGEKPPLTPYQRQKMIERLETELRTLDETIDKDNVKLEADKHAQEDAPFWDKHEYDDVIKADIDKKTADVNAKTEGQSTLGELKSGQ